MAISNRKLARASIMTGFFLVTYTQILGKDQDKEYDLEYDLIIHNLNFMGTDPDLSELKQLHTFPREKAKRIVNTTKLKIYSAIEKSCGSQIADWFRLTYEVCVVISVPLLIPGAVPTDIFGGKLVDYENELQELATRVGYPKSEFLHIMKSLDTSSPKKSLDKFIDESLEIVKSPYIFISHASEDCGIAEEFANMFEERNIKTFVANIDILAGTDWDNQLREEIYKSDELLLILSPEAMKSNWVMIEVGAAWILGKPITPAVMYTDVNSVPEPIKKFQAKPILTSLQRKKIVENIAKRVYRE